jgi:hypothetical protein
VRSILSKNKVVIRLTEERWTHILTGHPEMKELKDAVLETVRKPERIFAGEKNEYLAMKDFDGRKKLVVIYSEVNPADGFIITAYITSRIQKLEKLKQLWP